MNIEEAAAELQKGGDVIKTLATALKDNEMMMARVVLRRKDKPFLAIIMVAEDMCEPVLKVLDGLDDVYNLER